MILTNFTVQIDSFDDNENVLASSNLTKPYSMGLMFEASIIDE